MDFNKIHRLAAAIVKVRLDRADDAEREFLVDWLNEDEKNRTLYRDIIRGVTVREYLAECDRVDREFDFGALEADIVARLSRKRKMKRRAAAAYVASFIGVICISAALALTLGRGDKAADVVADSQPHGNVQLILHTGQRIDVDGSDTPLEDLLALAASEYYAADGTEEDADRMAIPMNRLVTFREGVGQITLGDGSKVWLNAMSELDFPAVFTDGERRVRLRGEAYFEVNADPERPFVVETPELAVRALGTSFNVQSYSDEQTVCTTLLSGRLEVASPAGENVVLEPGMQSEWSRAANTLTRKNVFVDDFTAWRHGHLIFTEKPLTDITRALTRWYDAEFIYQPGRAGEHTFTLKIDREQSLGSILGLITTAGGPAFEVNGRTVYVTER